jgi:chromosome segregation ATPase
LQVALKELELHHEELARALRADADMTITGLRLEFEREARELQGAYEDRSVRLREELTRASEDEIRGIEKRKTSHIRSLIGSHEKAFADLKLYYNEITHSNLDLIKSLKEEVEDLRKKEAGDEKVMYAIASENKKMSEPLRKTLEQVRGLKEAREAYRVDIQALAEAKAAVLVTLDRLENLRWEHEILEQRYARLVTERDALYDRFTRALHEVKQKAGFKALVLEERVVAASEAAGKAGALLSEVVAAAGLTGAGAAAGEGGVGAGAGAEVAARDATIAALRGELGRVAALHDEAIAVCLRAMADADVPAPETGFLPMSAREILAGGGRG